MMTRMGLTGGENPDSLGERGMAVGAWGLPTDYVPMYGMPLVYPGGAE